MKHKYNLRETRIREQMIIRPLWGIHQSEININIHFGLGCVHQAE